MKTLIAMFMMLALLFVTGCWNTSNKGGVAPTYEQFSVTVPSSVTIKQGEIKNVTVSLNRGSDFKQDVQLDVKADDISVTPTSILVKSSDNPDAQVQVAALKNAALGNYIFTVKGTPTNGKPTSTVCTVVVVAP